MATLDLNGQWQLRWYDGQRGQNHTAAERSSTESSQYVTATVPGEVHLDLMEQGILADTDLGANVLAARWVEEFIWTYRREFDAPEEATRQRSWLVFDRLFLNARIVLNGQEIGTHGNAFRPCRIDVTGKLKAGTNVLAVHVESGLYGVADKPSLGYAFHEDAKLHKRHWLRAPQCQFGWDWSPRLLNVGISGSVRLEWTDHPVTVDSFVPLASLDKKLSNGTVVGRVFLQGGEVAKEVQVTMEIPELGLSVAKKEPVGAGKTTLVLRLEVPNPEPWWPLGHGLQRRYLVRATVQAGDFTDVRESYVGFRHVRWDDSLHPVQGRYFRLFVNGRPIFAKGGNLVPADTLFQRIDAHRYQKLVDRALEANFNFLRVWGGGLYEPDEFYNLCDEKGILVWQEFIYACSRYPLDDEAFYLEAKEEAIHHVRRLASHPSLVAWCGNNENEVGNWEWGFDRVKVLPDYAFFHLTLPRILAEEDPTRYYQPSSPFSPQILPPNADHVGDQHPWSLGFFDVDTRKYRDMECRFPNEGGVMGPTSLPTMLDCLDGQPMRTSLAWRVHDNSIAQWREPSVIDGITEELLGKRFEEMSLEEYVYWGGLVQGEGLKEYIEAFRRRMFDSASAIFWMYNDTWPAVRSWTIVDHRLNRTPSFSHVQRAMAPVHVIPAVVADEMVVFGVNDTLAAVKGSLRYGLFDVHGDHALDLSVDAELVPNSSTALARFPMSAWSDPTSQIAFAYLQMPNGTIRNRLILPLWREMRWQPPQIAVRDGGSGRMITADRFVPGAAIGLEGGEMRFEDLYPGIPLEVPSGEPIHLGDMSRPGTTLRRL